MFWAVKQLLVPCNYLRIWHGNSLLKSKFVYDFVFPVALTVGTVGMCAGLNIPMALSGHKALFASLSSLLALLIAFYMAALAAVSTFTRRGIDKGLRGGDALLSVLNHTTMRRQRKALSYRQFISYLFGYLAFLSLALFIALMAMNSVWPHVKQVSQNYLYWDDITKYGEQTVFVLFVFGTWQLLVTSLLGIYFLSDRIQSLNDPHH